MMRLIITIGFLFCFVSMQAQKNKTILWVEKGSNGKYGIIDSTKKTVKDFQYDEIKRLVSENISTNECFRTKLNGKYGIIDKFGKEIISPKYDEITLRSQAADWIETKLNDKYGFADFIWSEKTKKYDELKEIFPPKFDSIFYSAGESAPSGFVQVKLHNKWGLVNDKAGKEITGMKYDSVSDFFFYQGHKWTEVEINHKYGLIDITGKEIISCKYDKILNIEGEDKNVKFKVQLGNREFYLDITGKEVK